ncbi:MAG: hypothetical protein RIR88_912 [Actinomycetota bacterium]
MTDDSTSQKSFPADREVAGPFDESEVSGVRPYVDLGAIKFIPREGLNLRLEVEEGSGRVVAVALDFNGSTLQVQPFAATRSAGLWNDIRSQISEQVLQQGGTVTEFTGTLGPELLCKIPAMIDGQQSYQDARFVGVDGPRWFLRGVIAGPAVTDADQAAYLIELFRDLVVVRGQAPMPPGELLPLRVPAQVAGLPSD